MEKRLIKKDALAGIVKKMAGDFLVYAPVKEEDNVLFNPSERGRAIFCVFELQECAEKLFLSPHGNDDEVYPDTEGDGLFGRGKQGGAGRSFRRPPLRCPKLCPPGHALRPGEVQGSLLHRQTGKDDRRLPGLRPSALYDLLLHLRGWSARASTGRISS